MLFVKLFTDNICMDNSLDFGKHKIKVYCISLSLFKFSNNFNENLMVNIYKNHV